MSVFFFMLGIFECALLWYLGRIGQKIEDGATLEHELVKGVPAAGWPPCALIVPVAGAHPNMEAALRSLAEQDYPAFTLYLVTASGNDPACVLINRLSREYPNIEHIIAGLAEKCGQKNKNLLAGVEACQERAEIYAFCDSTHIAETDFLRCLVMPIAKNEIAFTTGYHEVEPKDQGIVSLSYALCVMFMRFMQSVPKLAEPWGGAMAMSKRAWHTAEVAQLWEDNVVDDCSLAAMLQKDGIPVRLCPGALLRTFTINHPFTVWRAWLERQILFLKFCIPVQWGLLGFISLLLFLPVAWGLWACAEGILGDGGGMAPFLALCFFCALAWALGSWRAFFPAPPPLGRWLVAFICASFMFVVVYANTLFAHTLLWQNIIYRVGKGGKVLGMERQ